MNNIPSADGALTLVEADGQLYADSRNVAAGLGIQHDNFIGTVDTHKQLIESEFGVILFQTGKPSSPAGGRPARYALLTEIQANYIAMLSRNSPVVMRFKAALVKAFDAARNALKKSPTHADGMKFAFETIRDSRLPAPGTAGYLELLDTHLEAVLQLKDMHKENVQIKEYNQKLVQANGKAVAELEDTKEELDDALDHIGKVQPKVRAFQEFLSHDEAEHSWKAVADALRDHGVGRNRLLQILRDEKILIDGGVNHNTPYRNYIEAGYFRVKFHPDFPETPVTRTTTKGIAFLSRKLAQLRGRAKRAALQQQVQQQVYIETEE